MIKTQYSMKNFKTAFFAAMLFAALPFTIKPANAACSTPAGAAGDTMYNDTHNVPQYCDNTNWIAMVGSDPNTCPNGLVSCGGRPDERLVFITHAGSGNNNGSVDGFHAKCQLRADENGLTGVYKSWIAGSDPNSAPASHFEQSAVPYVGVDGTIIADNWTDLTDGTIDNGITLGPDGVAATPSKVIWSNVDTDGKQVSSDTSYHCDDWSINTTTGRNGKSGQTDFNWTNNGGRSCSNSLKTLCFEQNPGNTSITEIVPDGLIGHWRLDETSGTTAFDSSGIINNGNILGGVTLPADSVAAPISSGLTFDGTATSIVELPLNSAYDFTGPHAVSFWAKWNGDTSTSRRFFSRQLSGTNFWALRYRGADDSFQTIYNVGGSGFITSAGVGFGDGKWHHVAMVLDSSYNLILYLDGEAKHTKSGLSAPNFAPLASEKISIGGFRSGSPTENFIGELDDFRIYNNELTPTEVAEIYAARDGIRYNESFRTPEFFDGNKFVAMRPAFPEVDKASVLGDYPDLSCPNVGDVCSDGSVYVGLSPDENAPMYTTPADETGTFPWNNGNGAGTWADTLTNQCDENGPGSVIDVCNTGENNTTTIIGIDADTVTAGIQPHQAAEQCATLNAHGNNDWYLPAMEELWMLYDNRAAIGGFSTGFYWSSSEDLTYNARRINFNTGAPSTTNKDTLYNVRCVRRGDRLANTTAGLVGHWKLDETTGTTIADSSSYGYDATLNNITADANSVRGAVGNGIGFRTINAASALTSPQSTYSNITELTLAGWVRLDDSTENGGIIGLGLNTDDPLLSLENRWDTERLSFETYNWSGGTGAWSTDTDVLLPLGSWHHVAVTYSFNDPVGTAPVFYIDGQLYSGSITVNQTPSGTFTAPAIDIAAAIGRRGNATNNEWKGAVDDARIYNRALSASEIAQLYNMGTPIGSSTALPQGCPNIGDVCDDGTIYAGLSPDGSVEMFAASTDLGTMPWNDGNTDYTSIATSADDGDGNTELLVSSDSNSVTAGTQTHQAAQACFDLNAHGADDWYLPASSELNLTLLSGAVPVGTNYWSSQQGGDQTIAQRRTLTDPTTVATGNNPKQQTIMNVRCVRKGPAPRCANPYGLEGQMIYNSTHDVVQYCDGARWIALGKEN